MTIHYTSDGRPVQPPTSSIPDSFFRTLNEKEAEQFRQWVRDNHSTVKPEAFDVFHPVIREEWAKIDVEKGVI